MLVGSKGRLPGLSCGLPLNVLKKQFWARGGRSRVFVSIFYTPAVTLRFKWKPGRRPPHMTGRSMSTVAQGGLEPLTSSPRSDFTTLSSLIG